MSADAVVGACDDLVLHTEDLVDWKGDAQEGGMRGWIIPMRARARGGDYCWHMNSASNGGS